MGIARYEDVEVYDLTFATSAFGETVTTETLKFTSRPMTHEVKTNLAITDKYRVYSNLIQFTFDYTPYTKLMGDVQHAYSVKWRGNDWRIESAVESNDRMKITFICYRNDPVTKV